jgi:hypothetical protein
MSAKNSSYQTMKNRCIQLAKDNNFKLDNYKADYLQAIINKYDN